MKAKKKLNFIDRFFLWINILLCIGLLISYLAPVTDPAKFWPVAFFGLAYTYLLAGNLMLIVYWLFRKIPFALISIACIALGWNILNRNIGLRPSTDSTYLAGSDMLRVM
ncbi:MAG: hypothetical protein JST19_07140, partial [Bacteroidetes bacterium]|nr:hypothetical protein [Bacteroidota bacterium]